jgi:hypothetical protein
MTFVRWTSLRAMVLMLSLVGCGGTPAPNAGKPTLQAQSMQQMFADVKVLREYVQGVGTQSSAEASAQELVSWSDRLEAIFPGETAAQYVDLTPDMSRRASPVMRETSGGVAAAVRMGNRQEAGAQLARLERDGCGICHQNGYK